MSTLKANRYENTASSDGGINIDSSGKVGIGGVSSPSAPLHLNAGTTNNALFIDSSDAEVSIGLAASDGAVRLLQSSGGLVIRANGNANAFGTGDSERARFLAAGGLTFNGDTAAANALSDYEEGTWTPTAVSYSGTLTVNTASYVKVGKLCFVHAYVSFSNTTDSSNIILGGLPFTGFGANNNYYVISAHTNGGLEELNLRAQGTSSQLAAVHLSGGDGDSKPTYTSLANKFVIFSGCFKTT